MCVTRNRALSRNINRTTTAAACSQRRKEKWARHIKKRSNNRFKCYYTRLLLAPSSAPSSSLYLHTRRHLARGKAHTILEPAFVFTLIMMARVRNIKIILLSGLMISCLRASHHFAPLRRRCIRVAKYNEMRNLLNRLHRWVDLLSYLGLFVLLMKSSDVQRLGHYRPMCRGRDCTMSSAKSSSWWWRGSSSAAAGTAARKKTATGWAREKRERKRKWMNGKCKHRIFHQVWFLFDFPLLPRRFSLFSSLKWVAVAPSIQRR